MSEPTPHKPLTNKERHNFGVMLEEVVEAHQAEFDALVPLGEALRAALADAPVPREEIRTLIAIAVDQMFGREFHGTQLEDLIIKEFGL